MSAGVNLAGVAGPRFAVRRNGWMAACKNVSREECLGAALLGGAAYLPVMVQLGYSPIAVGWGSIVHDVVNAEISAFSLLFALAIADPFADRNGRRLVTYGMAVLISAIGGVLLGVAQSHLLWNGVFEPNALLRQKIAVNPAMFYTRYVSWVVEWLLIGGLVTYVHVDRRDARRAIARLHEASVRRSEQARTMFEVELQTLQARVEPGFLFRSLAQVRDLYDVDAVAGDAMLDELILYLRAAMPQMRDTVATLTQEFELVRSWVAIVDRRRVLATTFACDAEAASARIPSMLLLPIASALVAQRQRPDLPATLSVRVLRGHARLGITLALESDHQDGPPRAAVVATLRERLAALFGAQASLSVVADGARVEVLLEISDEADGADR